MAGLFQSPGAVQQALNKQQMAEALAIEQSTGVPGGAVLGLAANKLLGGLFGGGQVPPEVERAQRLEKVKLNVLNNLGPDGFNRDDPGAMNLLANSLADAGFLDEAMQVQGLALERGLTAEQANTEFKKGQLYEAQAEKEMFGDPNANNLLTNLSKNVLYEQELRASGNTQAADEMLRAIRANQNLLSMILGGGGLNLGVPGTGGSAGVPGSNIPILDFSQMGTETP